MSKPKAEHARAAPVQSKADRSSPKRKTVGQEEKAIGSRQLSGDREDEASEKGGVMERRPSPLPEGDGLLFTLPLSNTRQRVSILGRDEFDSITRRSATLMSLSK